MNNERDFNSLNSNVYLNNQNNLNQNNNYNNNGFSNQTLNNGVNNINNINNNNPAINSNDFNNLNSNINWNVSVNTNLNNQYNGCNNQTNENLTNNNQQNGINQFQTNVNQNQNFQDEKNNQYMVNSNNSKNLKNEKNITPKSKGFWIGLILAEIVGFIVLIMLATDSITNSNNRTGSTPDNFINVSNDNNYVVSDITNSHGNYNYVNNYYIAEKQNIVLEYMEYIDSNYAYYKYLDTKEYIQSKEGNVKTNMSNLESNNYNMYEVTTNDITYIVARSNNTILYTASPSEYRTEINQVFTDLGYSSNIGINVYFYLVFILMFALMVVIYWKIFTKAGEKGWKSLIPIYNIYVMFKIAFGKGGYFFLMLIPIANFVIIFMLWYKLAKAFGKSTGFAICNIFLSLFTLQIIAFDESEYSLKKN